MELFTNFYSEVGNDNSNKSISFPFCYKFSELKNEAPQKAA